MIIMMFLLLFQGYSEADYVAEIIKTEDIKKIEEVSLEAIKNFPDSYNLNLNIAYKYLILKKYKKSYSYYKKAYKIYPSIDALLGLTTTQINLKKYKALLACTDVALLRLHPYLHTSPLFKYIYLRRSYAYLMLKEYNNAISEADKGLEIYPDFDDLMKNRKYAEKMKPKVSLNLIPIWGMITYSNHDTKTSYDYFGGLLYLKYSSYNLDLGYTRGNVDEDSKIKTEHGLDIGLGYNDNYNLYIHFKKIFLEDENAMIPYLHFGYNYDFMSIIGALSISSYDFLDDLVYQGSIYSSFYFYDKRIIPTIAIGYKYLKKDRLNSQPYIDLALNLSVNKDIRVKTLFRYNQHRYFVDYGGIVDNSLDDIAWMAEIGLSLNLGGFIISPIYRYYSINAVPTILPDLSDLTGVIKGAGGSGGRGDVPTVSKSFFTVLLGYSF